MPPPSYHRSDTAGDLKCFSFVCVGESSTASMMFKTEYQKYRSTLSEEKMEVAKARFWLPFPLAWVLGEDPFVFLPCLLAEFVAGNGLEPRVE